MRMENASSSCSKFTSAETTYVGRQHCTAGCAVLSFPQIKYLRVPDEVIEKVKDTQLKDQAQRGGRGGGQTGRGDRGRGGGRGGRGGRGRGRGAA